MALNLVGPLGPQPDLGILLQQFQQEVCCIVTHVGWDGWLVVQNTPDARDTMTFYYTTQGPQPINQPTDQSINQPTNDGQSNTHRGMHYLITMLLVHILEARRYSVRRVSGDPQKSFDNPRRLVLMLQYLSHWQSPMVFSRILMEFLVILASMCV